MLAVKSSLAVRRKTDRWLDGRLRWAHGRWQIVLELATSTGGLSQAEALVPMGVLLLLDLDVHLRGHMTGVEPRITILVLDVHVFMGFGWRPTP